MTLVQLFTAIANAIRSKKGTSAAIAAEDFATEIANIPTGVDTSDANAVAGDIVTGKTAYAKGLKLTGTYTGIVPTGSVSITENGTVDVTNYASADVNVSGGGGGAVEPKDVNFYDYDGTLLHSYTLAEANALTELPELPTREGLTCQEWNWSLANIKLMNRAVDVGATYITNDEKTRIIFQCNYNGPFTITLCYRQTVANGVEIDWGDGSAVQTFSGSGNTRVMPTHTYTTKGIYTISFNPTGNCVLTLGGSSSSYNVVGIRSSQNDKASYLVLEAHIGKQTSIGAYAFQTCYNLKFITIPKNALIDTYCFSDCNSLDNVIIPDGTTYIYNYTFSYCRSLSRVIFPKSIETLGQQVFATCNSLTDVILPDGLTTISTSCFTSCFKLKRIFIPNSVTSLGTYAFYNCPLLREANIPNNISIVPNSLYGLCSSLIEITIPSGMTVVNNAAFQGCLTLSEVFIPKTVSTLGTNLFNGCWGLLKVDLSQHEQVPALNNQNSFSNTSADLKIVVPDALYEDWKTASNWSNWASHIVKASEA